MYGSLKEFMKNEHPLAYSAIDGENISPYEDISNIPKRFEKTGFRKVELHEEIISVLKEFESYLKDKQIGQIHNEFGMFN